LKREITVNEKKLEKKDWGFKSGGKKEKGSEGVLRLSQRSGGNLRGSTPGEKKNNGKGAHIKVPLGRRV